MRKQSVLLKWHDVLSTTAQVIHLVKSTHSSSVLFRHLSLMLSPTVDDAYLSVEPLELSLQYVSTALLSSPHECFAFVGLEHNGVHDLVSSRDTVWTHVFEEYDGPDLCPLILCQVETQFSVGIISSMVSTALVSSWHKVRYCHLDQVG